MHPALRILVFALFSATLALYKTLAYGLLAGIVLTWLAWRVCPPGQVWRALARLRWFFLSLLILGVGFPPLAGDYLGGLWFSLAHIAVLALILLAAQILLATTQVPQLIAALDWLLAPLAWLGLPTGRFSLRLALALDTVEAMQRLVQAPPPLPPGNARPLERIGQRAAGLFLQAMHRGETEPLRVLEIPDLGPPPLWQWLYPAGVLGLAWLCRVLVSGMPLA